MTHFSQVFRGDRHGVWRDTIEQANEYAETFPEKFISWKAKRRLTNALK